MTSIEETRELMDRYLRGHDMTTIAEDAVFVVMATGQAARGRDAIDQMLDYFYSKAFTARFETKNIIIGESNAVLEADFIGKQNLEFAGNQPTGNVVHVPLCVVYSVKDGKIVGAQIYFESDALKMQAKA